MPWKLTRQEIDALLYGGRYQPRFTQDSPILPDVWIKYAEEPDAAHEVLVTPYQDPVTGPVTAGRLSRALKACLSRREARRPLERRRGVAPSAGPGLAYNQATVLARLTFDELVRVIIPLSAWWHQIGEPDRGARGKAASPEAQAARRRTERARLIRDMRKPAGRARLVAALLDPASAKPPLSVDIVWMVHVIGSIRLFAAEQQTKRFWPLVDDMGDRSNADSQSYRDALRKHYQAVVEHVLDLTQGLERAPWDAKLVRENQPLVWSVSLNRPARSTLWRSRATVKADAAVRLFDITCHDLTWAVLDTGINAKHIAFRARTPDGVRYRDAFEGDKDRTRIVASYDFSVVHRLLSEETLEETARELGASRADAKALEERLANGDETDWELVGRLIRIPHEERNYREPKQEHGTHVAGILAGDCRVNAHEEMPSESAPAGLCPDLQLYDLRVFDDEGKGEEFNIMSALQFVRHLNTRREAMAVHGVNLSLSLRHDVANFACGRTPVCEECERLVGAGIVVVAAAGNDGYLQYITTRGPQDSYRSISITDPGNAAGVITVGSTHRFQPHTYGVSYFSSRGPTGDGRAKPDLVAPGEKIKAPVGATSDLKRMDGTSMAAPHVSGAAALLIARHRELAGQPARIKEVLCTTATDLGRERYFQGAGLIDVLRALQSF